MAAGFKEFIERGKALTVNGTIAERYVSFLSGREKPNQQSRLSYCTMVMLFLESIDEELETLKIEDVENYNEKDGSFTYEDRVIFFCQNICGY